MKHLKKYLSVFIFMIMIFSSCANSKNNEINIEKETNEEVSIVEISETIEDFQVKELKEQNINIDEEKDDDLNIKYKELKDEEKGILYQSAKYPVITLSKKFKNKIISYFINNINKKFANSAKEYIESNKQFIRDLYKERGGEEHVFCEYENELTVNIYNDKIIQIVSNSYQYSMGAHGTTYINVYNINKNTGSIIDLDDVIIDKQKFKQYLIDYIDTNYKDMVFEDYKNTIDDFMKGNYEFVYSINESDLTITFNQYDIAPYAAGILDVKIDFENNKNILNEKYF